MARIRARRMRSEGVPSDPSHVEALMQSIAEWQDQIASLATAIKDAEINLQSQMHSLGVTEHQYNGIEAALVRPAGRSSTVIDPQKFRKLVEEKVFYACISVSVTKAKTEVAQKTLDKISKTTPATPGPEKVVVSRISTKTKRA